MSGCDGNCDAGSKTLCYAILPPNPYPMLHYRSTITIDELSPRRSRVCWAGEYTVASGTDPSNIEQLLRKVYLYGIELLVRYFNARVCAPLPGGSRR